MTIVYTNGVLHGGVDQLRDPCRRSICWQVFDRMRASRLWGCLECSELRLNRFQDDYLVEEPGGCYCLP